MHANLGPLDRALRVIAGLAILSLLFILNGPNRWWSLVGLLPMGTAMLSWCPAYVPFGISTRTTR